MKTLYLFILLMFSCEVIAQEDYNAILQRQNAQINSLNKDIEQIENLIATQKDKLYNLKLSWYNICVNYLKKGIRNFKAHELENLLKNTKNEIDGDALFNELAKAKACYEYGKPYTYQNVPPPIKETVQPDNGGKDKKKKNDPKDNPSKKKPVKKDPEKKDNKVKKDKKDNKDKKDENPPIEESPSPTTPVINPEVKENPIIESDPNKIKPGEEKTVVETPIIDDNPIVETPVKEENPVIETPIKGDNPVVDPEVHKKEAPSSKKKTPEKDKGEIDEYKSKKSKNKDGSK